MQQPLAESPQRNRFWRCLTVFSRLKPMVRKRQVYARLKETNVPTVEFDGSSLFANFASQLDDHKSSVEMILDALKMFSTPLVTATLLEEKPRIGEWDERFTELEFTWRASVDVDAFFNNCAPALDAAFSGIALAKSQKPAFVPVKDSKESGIAYQVLSGSDIKFQEEVEFRSLAAIPLIRQKNKWVIVFYRVDRRILEKLPKPARQMLVVARFRDSAGSPLLEVLLTSLRFQCLRGENYPSQAQGRIVTPAPWEIGFSFIPLLQSAFYPITSRTSNGRLAARDTVVAPRKVERSFWPFNQREFDGASILDHRSRISVPTGLLSRISEVDLIVEPAA